MDISDFDPYHSWVRAQPTSPATTRRSSLSGHRERTSQRVAISPPRRDSRKHTALQQTTRTLDRGKGRMSPTKCVEIVETLRVGVPAPWQSVYDLMEELYSLNNEFHHELAHRAALLKERTMTSTELRHFLERLQEIAENRVEGAEVQLRNSMREAMAYQRRQMMTHKDMMEDMERARRRIEELRRVVDEKDQELAVVGQKVGEFNDTHSQLQAKLRKKQGQCDMMAGEIQTLRGDLLQRDSEHQQQAESIQREMTTMQGELHRGRDRTMQLMAELQTTADDLQSSRTEATRLKGEIEEVNSKNEYSQKKFKQMQKDYETLRAQEAANRTEFARAGEECNQLQKTLEMAKQHNKELTVMGVQLRKELEAARNETERTKEKNNALQRTAATHEAEITNLKTHLQATVAENQEIQGKYAKQDDIIAKLQRDLQAERAAKDKLSQEHAELQQKYNKSRKELQTWRERLLGLKEGVQGVLDNEVSD